MRQLNVNVSHLSFFHVKFTGDGVHDCIRTKKRRVPPCAAEGGLLPLDFFLRFE
jgi:hypothetical protein